jgi:non-specific serine/threonine protein kinase
MTFSNSIQNDWFDIKMTVVSDDFEFNFSDLIPNIKAKSIVSLTQWELFLIPLNG